MVMPKRAAGIGPGRGGGASRPSWRRWIAPSTWSLSPPLGDCICLARTSRGCVPQVSKPAVSQVSKPAVSPASKPASTSPPPAGLETCGTADLEVCATPNTDGQLLPSACRTRSNPLRIGQTRSNPVKPFFNLDHARRSITPLFHHSITPPGLAGAPGERTASR